MVFKVLFKEGLTGLGDREVPYGVGLSVAREFAYHSAAWPRSTKHQEDQQSVTSKHHAWRPFWPPGETPDPFQERRSLWS